MCAGNYDLEERKIKRKINDRRLSINRYRREIIELEELFLTLRENKIKCRTKNMKKK